MWTGQTTLQLAKTMEAAAKEGATGLYNMVPSENISKYHLLCLFNKYLRNQKLEIEPFDGFVCDKTLIRTNFDFGYLIPDYETMVAELALFMEKHKEMYHHYVY
jgi:dTDP-4-dehydrorhamnose reductase